MAAIWDDAMVAQLRAAVGTALAGAPTLVVVEAGAGMGKSSLLDLVTSLAADRARVRRSAALESDRETPYAALMEWGVDVPGGENGAPAPLVAAQALRDALDPTAGTPALLRFDDLQWADPQSVEAVMWLLRRSTVEPLLVVVAHRPLAPDVHPSWQRWVAGRPGTVLIRLSGLDENAVHAIAIARRPGLSREATDRLTRHTRGNPLYLTTLLAEFDEVALSRPRDLPAPAEFSGLVGRRSGRLPEPARRMLHACAVLGDGWSWLSDVAAVAGITDPAGAVDDLRGSGLIEIRTVDIGLSVRVVHSLVRAAVLQTIPLTQRRELHLAAAGSVVDPVLVLDHLVAAADRHDDGLADRLTATAAAAHDRCDHRTAARLHRAAATLTSDPVLQESRWLTSLFDSLLGQDTGPARAEMSAVHAAGDRVGRTLVLAALATVEGRWSDSVRVLRTAPFDEPVDEYRRQVLLGWGLVGSGGPTEEVVAAMAAADATGVGDPALAGHAESVRFYAVQRTRGLSGVLDLLADVPDDPRATPPGRTFALASRGSVRTRMGLFDAADADLGEVRRRFEDGQVDIADGLYTAVSGFLYWLRGDWDRARARFHLAADAGVRFVQPTVAAYLSILPSSSGNTAESDRWIGTARTTLAGQPWQEADRLRMVAEVVRAHARGDRAFDPAVAAGLMPVLDGMLSFPGDCGLVELMHGALALLLCNRAADARLMTDAIGRQQPAASIAPAIVDWLHGLIAERAGERRAAVAHLTSACGSDRGEAPLYRAHMLSDLSRAATDLGRSQPSAAAEAASIYRQLGARPYLDRMSGGRRPAVIGADPGLSDREREVLRLVVLGFSYAQVARELFISRSTVGFHLSNIYAKTGVGTRHELTALVRADARSFGMPAPAV
ncbi:hypothetical protein GIS00_14205 [Nakamurella sp. YIM 132087]|uniref:HTH luxR-type domain-containing protein n=1 Tax=Nakamurella alba TaxID=2665158 RepID=A0A7K1FLS2_9ACTN|nr:LuxR C-terminal-related transcriptional regulator [Nakamurella alba]MTD15092.1 hypothetical protein [Nakamurella alba]